MKTRISLCVFVVWLLLASCSQVGDLPFFGPTATLTPSPTPTETPTPTPVPTPTPTPTPLPAARVESGEHALRNGDWDTALSEFSAASEGPDNEVRLAAALGEAQTLLFSGNSAQAIDALEQIIQNYPESPRIAEAHFLLGQAYSASERYTEAAQAYLDYLTARPGVIDGYVLNLRGDALFAAGQYAEATKDFQAALSAPSLNDSILLQLKLARAYSLAGDYATALTLYDDVYQRSSNDSNRALVDLRKGQIYTAMGDMAQAYASYQDTINNFPTAYESYSALLELVNAGEPVDELNRGLVDYFAGQYGVAMAAFDRYLQGAPPSPDTAHYYYGLAMRALGGYQGAVGQWDEVIQNDPSSPFWDDAWEQKAYTQWYYLDQYTAATQTLLDFVATAPDHPRAGEFLFDAAQVAERAGELDQAATLWERVINEYPGYEQAPRALFLAGITHYRMKDYSASQAIFQRLLGVSATPGDKAMADFWIGKTQKAQGDDQAASATWETTAGLDPTGYYSERALDILRGREPFTPPQAYDLAIDLNAEKAKADQWMKATFALPEDTNLSGLGSLAEEGAIKRGTELWNLGMFSEARNEFEQLRLNLKNDPVLSYRLANYLFQLGVYRSAILAARQVLDLAGMDDFGTMSAPIYFNHLRFGTYFSDLILPVAQEYQFHPLFLFSLVRQESLFESFVQSSAAASGLMQIVPATGADIAQNLGWPENYTNDDLYRPIVSIRFGVHYLNAQRSTFKGDLYSALAAYNGGPGNAAEWKRLAPDDPDLFLEVVRYSETRNYIRGIYEIFNIYRRIYDRSP